MKTLFWAALLAVALAYYHGPTKRTGPATDTSDDAASASAANRAAPAHIVVAAAPSYHDRWKTGPNACTDLKTGPDAQSHFEPFLPTEQANWNQHSGYTITSGAGIRPH